ncbi:hypothetical protein TOPH_04660 [Tolypocladium ophioglossoides CBS 100239]|uniref:DUF8035 domain-containing protein n=1 Tax=Tolypocladium ophioglossoides (strain CBS 100239) TaxID=1163406 RepID=A0A0L0MYJ5_TOLOC|nr:hypothetical protein TOPH_08446 [Tolypocladium ophioglossoides CBS 100239]KND90487.1 hypothetical protein TOPH_04660 [Tolypocladium ophioglossoides CBS 100239]
MAGERWDRDRLTYERDRVEDDRYYMSGGRGRDRSDERHDRRRVYEDDQVRDRRYYDDDPRLDPRRERAPPPDYDRRVVMEEARDREYYQDAAPRRPALLRRQSSLDTYDRRPLPHFYDRDELPPPARREDMYRDDYRAPPYTPIPLPKTRALPPPRRYPDRGFYDDIDVADGDEEYRHFPERVHERELVRSREKRDRSRESRTTRTTRTHTHRSSSRSSTATSRSSGSAGGTTVRSEYPKKGKTKIPVRLVSKRALIDLSYPFVQEGNTIIVQKALGQENIDELLKLSEEYNKAEQEVAAARSSAGNIIEERREEIFIPPAPFPIPPPPATAAPPLVVVPPRAPPAPVIVDAGPVEVVDTTRTFIRESSPARTATTSSWDSHHHRHHHDDLVVGPIVERSRSRSRSGRDIRAEIRALERELAHRPRGEIGEREVIRTERLPDGQLVVYEEKVERQVAGPKPPRIEKDKKGPPPRLVRAMLSTLT